MASGSNSSNPQVLRIVGRSNGVGLDRDAALVQESVSADIWTERHPLWSTLPVQESVMSTLLPRGSDIRLVSVFLERMPALWKYCRGLKLLIPNQERFPERHLGRLQQVDGVLCKSRHAEQVFRKYTDRVSYIGFTSVDRSIAGIEPDYSKILHVAGRSTMKGTERIIDLWRQNPSWPMLTIVQHPDNASGPVPANVQRIVEYMSDDELRRLQNEHGIHLCPSEAEGWGHYIVEAMSCRAAVITTDGPPMNELIDSSRGFLLPWNRSSPRHLGTCYYFDEEKLSGLIESLHSGGIDDIQQRGLRAREWYLANDAEFKFRMQAAIETLTIQSKAA